MSGWIGVDLDGTLAYYESWIDETHVGEPIPLMVERVKQWLSQGIEVKIFTARVAHPEASEVCRQTIQDWAEKYLGKRLEVTATKDYAMIELWDDRAVQVIPNTGKRADAVH